MDRDGLSQNKTKSGKPGRIIRKWRELIAGFNNLKLSRSYLLFSLTLSKSVPTSRLSNLSSTGPICSPRNQKKQGDGWKFSNKQ